MNLTEYLAEEWVPALGCTEPASIALAASTAAKEVGGGIKSIRLVVDPKIYKNCYAVGIPNSGHKTGILWTVAAGAEIPDPALGLQCFRALDASMLKMAQKLIDGKKIEVIVDTEKTELFIDCTIEGKNGKARVVIARDHTNIVRVELNGKASIDKKGETHSKKSAIRALAASMSTTELIDLASSATEADISRIEEGIALNKKIAHHGLSLFPKSFIELTSKDELSHLSALVCGGVYARMWGEDFPVMSLAGSGNKGITVSVPLAIHGESLAKSRSEICRAIALAALVTSATTHHLGSLSAVCGCSNAAGIGLAAALVLIGGGEKEISLAITNMVGNVTGMICDGAKIGCAMKTMTAVDSAFRASTLALGGIGIPAIDGIVGKDGRESLKNLGRIAVRGMVSTDAEILAIMQDKLK